MHDYTAHPHDNYETGAGPYTGQTGVDLGDSGNGGDIDWAALVGATLGGTAAIIRAAEGTPAAAAPSTLPTYDPYAAAQKKAAGIPTWVYLAGGGLLLVVLLGQRK